MSTLCIDCQRWFFWLIAVCFSFNEGLYQSLLRAKGNNYCLVASVHQDYISCIEPDAGADNFGISAHSLV
jgi:hypothetical protein